MDNQENKMLATKTLTLNPNETFYIVGANDFNPIQLAELDRITTTPLQNARWALDGSAFIVMFVAGDTPSPMMDLYPSYTNVSIQPILANYPWSISF